MGVAHHAAYLVWFEAARVEWIRALGFPFGAVEASGYLHAVREAHVQYRRPARFDQLLALRLALVAAGGPRLVFGYRLFDAAERDAAAGDPGGAIDPEGSATALAVGRTEMVWVTPAGRPTRLPATHPFTPVLAAMERHPDWGQW
jgi:acyl-CoA thioester hydrolase